MRAIPWDDAERLVRRDPGGRGVATYLHEGRPLASGHLRQAAETLAEATAVGIVTGFCIPTAEGVAAETDGPSGALFLARALLSLGIETALISDAYGVPVLEAGCDHWGLPQSLVREIPFEHRRPEHPSRQSNDPPHNARTDRWVDGFLEFPFGQRLTHLIAIERAGPSHTLDSVSHPPGGEPAHVELFSAAVSPEHRNACHNMRGESINAHTAKAHRLFERLAERGLPTKIIGIGDGGNEIGMGSIPWNVLWHAIGRGPGALLPCRIAADWTILAGVSNWGGYALALSLMALKDARQEATAWDADDLKRLIQSLVRESFCVDGVTKQREPSVDGLPLEKYLQVFTGLREMLA